MAKLLEIIKHPNKILRIKSKEINLEKINNSDFIKLLKDMEKTMLAKDGAGLAAPQIGENIRLIIISHENKANNPVIHGGRFLRLPSASAIGRDVHCY